MNEENIVQSISTGKCRSSLLSSAKKAKKNNVMKKKIRSWKFNGKKVARSWFYKKKAEVRISDIWKTVLQSENLDLLLN